MPRPDLPHNHNRSRARKKGKLSPFSLFVLAGVLGFIGLAVLDNLGVVDLGGIFDKGDENASWKTKDAVSGGE